MTTEILMQRSFHVLTRFLSVSALPGRVRTDSVKRRMIPYVAPILIQSRSTSTGSVSFRAFCDISKVEPRTAKAGCLDLDWRIRSSVLEVNSLPWSTVIAFGKGRCQDSRSRASATSLW